MSASDSSPPRKPGPGSDRSKPGGKTRERRLEERIPVNSQILICCPDRRGGQRRIKARAVNVSTSGILLRAEEAVPIGTAVILQTSDFVVLGRASVRHCEAKGMQYTLGLYVPDRVMRTF
jgi:hypothetical protein